MLKRSLFLVFSVLAINPLYCNVKIINYDKITNKIIVGAESINEYKPLILSKKIGIVANHTSQVLVKLLFTIFCTFLKNSLLL
jgi:hypothetical protein